MPSTQNDPLQSPQSSDNETPITNPKTRQPPLSTASPTSPLASVANFSYRQANASISQLFQSTTSLPPSSESNSGTATPVAGTVNGSVFSPGGSTRVGSPGLNQNTIHGSGATRDLILTAFAPHVSVLASQDADELVRHKGVDGGLLELLRPFGERVQGKVTIRDSSGASLSWDDYAIKFMGIQDGLESPRLTDRRSIDSQSRNSQRLSALDFRPARLRSGGDISQVEDLVERHLTFAEEHSGPVDYISHKDDAVPQGDSPFYLLYLRRLLSGMPMVPSETISQPVATVIAISSRSKAPIEELRNLFAASNNGEHRLPPWVLNEFLRYYILIHDEDYDDIQKSMALFEQMKRHFGLHCHLLRLRSTQCVPSDDDSMKLPWCQWMSAAEELTEITRKEACEDEVNDAPYIFDSDATAIRAFVREMVTQSIIPSLERASNTWNDQVASRRRGISGRFMSLSKRITTFSGRATTPVSGATGSSYDSVLGFYRPDAPEAIMRRLADYSLMLRDFKLAQSTLDILCSDYKNDKAWRYYAGANEMAAVSGLLSLGAGSSTKLRADAVDQHLEAAHYSYITRVGSPYHALRALLLGVELLKPRNGAAIDDAARWLSRVVDDRLVGQIGHALLLQRIAVCYTERKSIGGLHSGTRRRKAAFWNALAGDAWLRLDKTSQAEKAVSDAVRQYRAEDGSVNGFSGIHHFLLQLQNAVKANRAGPKPFVDTSVVEQATEVEALQDAKPISPTRAHRKSLSVASARLSSDGIVDMDPLGVLSAGVGLQGTQKRDDGFE